MDLTDEQKAVLKSNVKDLVVSASAGSGKTFVVIEKLIHLICKKKIPIERLLVLTFTKAASNEMKNRLTNAILEKKANRFLLEQLDSIPLSDISTIDSFCEKIIKRNINKLNLDENFTILDEKISKNLKKIAFSRTYQYFSNKEEDKFEEIYFAFKRNKSAIEDCINSLHEYLTSTTNPEELLTQFENNIISYNKLAQEDLVEKIKKLLALAYQKLTFVDQSQLKEKAENVYNQLLSFTKIDTTKNLFEISKAVNSLLPFLSLNCSMEDDDKKYITLARDYIKDVCKITENYNAVSDDISKKAENGLLIKALISFYRHFADEYKLLKEKRDGLDFADIESYAKLLLEDDEVKKALQDKYDYIFIDEYQDTNRLQQSILMPIAQGGHFVAVGDLKQGIYGFRNARMEIMQEDIENFKVKDNAEALFLKGNFRTDGNILDFVNLVFEKVMTTQSCGIDYIETSKLTALKHYEEGKMPSVIVDVIDKKPAEKKKKEDKPQQIYSVKDDVLVDDNTFTNEILAIQNRIEEALLNEIYDAKLERYRKVNYNDITLLFRSRTPLMEECYKFLSKKGFPINADIKETLLDDGEISAIYSLLKLTLNQHDDIALASAMTSHFGQFTLNRLAELRLKNDSKLPFYQIIEDSQEQDIIDFKEKIKKLTFDIQVFGIIKSLNMFFNQTKYFDYLACIKEGNNKISKINSLYKLIRSLNLDNSVAGVINQLEGVNENGSGGGGDCITMTTIHATKGLEYPIVILCGAGDSLTKSFPKSFVFSEKYGFASYLNDFDNLIRIPSPAFLAGKSEKSAREFIDEIMIFYVAITRARNHLFIIGSCKMKELTFDFLDKQNSYLKMIFFALGENLTSQIISQDSLTKGKWEFNIFDEVEDKPFEIEKNQTSKVKFDKELENFNKFQYKNKDICKLAFKNSVTGDTKLNSQTEIFPNRTESNENTSNAIDIGNAYHEALKILDFEKINTLEDLISQKAFLIDNLTEGYFDLLDLNILLTNILIIKNLTGKDKLYKEKEFIMSSTLDEIGLQGQDKIIVQGIVDLFAVGKEITLIDYKFSSLSADQLVARYGKQIQLYSLALEKCFNKKINNRYLLSLKNAQLIKL